MEKISRIYIAGHEGMIGSILLKKLINRGYKNLIYKSFKELDLRNQKETLRFILTTKPEYIFLIAGKVGGIQANIRYPAEFLYDNVMIATNVIEAARLCEAKKLLFLGSSCIYPRLSPQPMREDYLLSGLLEPTNEGYAIGKITGLKLCEYYYKQYGCKFISAIPPNIYGPGDNFKSDDSHVISALIRKVHDAKERNMSNVEIWGTGNARREFLYNEDLVDGIIFIMNNYDGPGHINVGSGEDISIKELAIIIKDLIGFKGQYIWDKNKPDGMPKKLMDSSRVFEMGWKPRIDLKTGLTYTYEWYLSHKDQQK